MEGQVFERRILNEKEKEILERNRVCLSSVIEKNKQLKKLIEDKRFRPLRHSEYFYPLKDWREILGVFKELETALYEIVEDPNIRFSAENNIDHLLGNGIQMYSGLVSFYLKKSGFAPEEEKRGKDDLEKEQLEQFGKGKETWDLTLYYADYLRNPENKKHLIEEVSSNDGFLDREEIRTLLKGEGNKKPQGHFSELKLFNFFAMVEGYNSGVAHLRGMEKIIFPISLENFEEEFDKLGVEDYFDKEKTREYVSKFSSEKIKEAA